MTAAEAAERDRKSEAKECQRCNRRYDKLDDSEYGWLVLDSGFAGWLCPDHSGVRRSAPTPAETTRASNQAVLDAAVDAATFARAERDALRAHLKAVLATISDKEQVSPEQHCIRMLARIAANGEEVAGG